MTDDDAVRVFVEIPKGSRNKYELNPETGNIELDRRLYASVSFPTEYGFIPDTLAGDGDELDAMVCTTEPTFPGCIIRARPVGLLLMRMKDGDGEPNPKVVCVPFEDPAWNHIEQVDELPEELRDEIGQFFDVYKDLEGSTVEVEGWRDRDAALDAVAVARERKAAEG